MSSCLELQREELEVVEAIYPDFVADSDIRKGSVKLEIPIEFDTARRIHIEESSEQNPTSCLSLALSLLPPLLIHVLLPPDYPLDSPPQLISIHTTHLWIPPPRHSALQHLLNQMWQQGEGALYNWIQFIHSGKFLDKLGLVREDVLYVQHSSPQLLAALLTAYEASARSSEFNQNSYPCSVCLASFKGSKCLQLSCSHIFCRSCLEDFWGFCITTGEISRVGCPDPECVKDGRLANEEEVARTVPEDVLARWRWLKEKSMMEKDPTISVCPMVLCQKPVSKPPISDDENSGWQRLRTCPSCSYSFCSFCRRTWHGPVSACPISGYETLVLDYLACPEGSEGRKTIEQRFGRAIVTKMVAQYEEEQAFKQWLSDSATACPGCNVQIEKSVGCNHMTCSKCKQHFCYRCGAKLPANSPYQHFSTPGLSCFNKLFDFNSEVDEWEPIEGFRG